MTTTSPIQYSYLPVDQLVKNEHNPNKMSPRQFNMLVDNIKRVGFTDPIFVRKLEDGKYRIIGGHHRLEAAIYLEYTEVPVSIQTSPDFDDDQEKFQLMRHNMIRGKLDVAKFMTLYQSVADKYETDVLAEAFGFEEQAALDKLIKQTQKTLPPEMKDKFKEAAKEVKTIADLSKLLNSLFTSHGDTLPYGYMFMDFGGKDSIWVRMTAPDLKLAHKVGEFCQKNSRSFDSVMRAALQLIAADKMPEEFSKLVAASPAVVIKEAAKANEDALDQYLQ